jgi:hypothetical protein
VDAVAEEWEERVQEDGMTAPDSLEPFDRVVLVSFQPDKQRAATQLANAAIRGLAKIRVREGDLVVQLDELLDGADVLFGDVPFLPSDPVALCATGRPRLVASLVSGIASSTKTRFARMRSPVPVPGLRVGAFVRNDSVTVDRNREFGTRPDVLARAKWNVVPVADEDGLVPELIEAEQLLAAFASGTPTAFVPPKSPPEPSRHKSALDALKRGAVKRGAARRR